MKILKSNNSKNYFFITVVLVILLLVSDVSCSLKHKKKNTLRKTKKLNKNSETLIEPQNPEKNFEINQKIGLLVLVPLVVIVLLITFASIIGFIMLVMKTPNINETNMKQIRILQYLNYQSQQKRLLNDTINAIAKKKENENTRIPEPESETVFF